jgi:hypothetical protein
VRVALNLAYFPRAKAMSFQMDKNFMQNMDATNKIN